MIIPRVKRREKKSGKLSLGEAFAFYGDDREYAARYFGEFYPSKAGECESGGVRLERDSSLGAEEYKIVVDGSVSAYFSDRLGLRNALSSLVQLVERDGDGYRVPCGEIFDSPDCGFRSVMIDLARGLPDKTRLKEDLKRLALFKCNVLHLHLVDSRGTCYVSDVISFGDQINGTDRVPKSWLVEIAEYCRLLGLEVVPEIEAPSHASALWLADENVRCKTNLADPSPANVCAGSEYVYELLTALIDEILEIFGDCRYFHVGGDEIAFEDYPDWNHHCHFDECSTCRETAKREGLEPTVQEMYYYLMRRLHDILAARGKTMIMWNDEIDLTREVPLPKDVVVQYWQTAAPGRGPWQGATYRGYMERGFKVINSAVAFEYINDPVYFNPERASGFVWNETPDPGEFKSMVLGAESCAWEYGNPRNTHYLLSFAFSTALMLDRAWNSELVCYGTDYRRSLTRAMLGEKVPTDYDVTALFGSVAPPRVNGEVSFATVQNELYRKGQVAPIAAKLDEVKSTYSPTLLGYLKTAFAEEK